MTRLNLHKPGLSWRFWLEWGWELSVSGTNIVETWLWCSQCVSLADNFISTIEVDAVLILNVWNHISLKGGVVVWGGCEPNLTL